MIILHSDNYNLKKLYSDIKLFNIPIFQRHYEWGPAQWENMWETVCDASQNHQGEFIGVFVLKQEYSGPGSPYIIIDGQQRMITLSLLLAALRDTVSSSLNNYSEIQKYLLIDPDKYKQKIPNAKLIASYQDREQYNEIINGTYDSINSSFKIHQSYNFFITKISSLLQRSPDINLLYTITESIIFIVISLSDLDNAGSIFQRLNSTNLQLGDIDLIRNYLFTWIDKTHQDQYYNEYWKPIEKSVTELNKNLKIPIDFLEYIRAIFAIRNVSNIIENKEFDYLLKSLRSNNQFTQNNKIEDFLISLHGYWNYFLILKVPYKDNALPPKLRRAIERFRFIPYTYHVPILIKIFKEFKILDKPHDNTQTNLCEILTLFETYYVRKEICNELLDNAAETFAEILKALNSEPDKEKYFKIITEKISPVLISKEEFKNCLLFDPLYSKSGSNSILKLILFAIEQELSGGNTAIPSNYNQLSIEHVMPQKLDESWISSNIDDRDKVHALWCNTLGNLTLVTNEFNSELTNKSFPAKKRIYKKNIGYLIMNEIISQDFWGETEIQYRGRFLTDICLDIWSHDGIGIKFNKPISKDKLISCTIKGKKYETFSNWVDLFKLTLSHMYCEERFLDIIKDYSNIVSLKVDKVKNCKSFKVNNNEIIYYKQIAGPVEVYKNCKIFVKAMGWTSDEWSGEIKRKQNNDEFVIYRFK